jgi:hypothetical protein
VEIAHLYFDVKPEKSIQYIDEAKKMITNHLSEKNSVVEPLYADLLLAVSRMHYLEGNTVEAINITKKAHTIFQRYLKEFPYKYIPETARSLYILGYLHITEGENSIAREYLAEGISLMGPYMSEQADLYEGLMNNLITAFEQTGIKGSDKN